MGIMRASHTRIAPQLEGMSVEVGIGTMVDMSSGEPPAQVVERPPAGGAPVPATPVQVSPPSGPDLATLVMVVLGVVIVAALYLLCCTYDVACKEWMA